ncbi:uncharacterized protein K02A2.6-like [Pseudomyrmex gracilis]|uniref:uncharacterized protein K02A2.6-like n=1 Tax=Pseudomyrmex gracilis TaxID=219809 RepID=UPI0009959510|nr:uncharacterized protein K02A2.6-like [Pseudomyrmex gracilis]
MKTLENPSTVLTSTSNAVCVKPKIRKRQSLIHSKQKEDVTNLSKQPSSLKCNGCVQYDSCSDVTIIGKDTWLCLGSPTSRASKTIEHAGGNSLKTSGCFSGKLRAAGHKGIVTFDVVSRDGLNLFDLNAIDKLDLWSMSFGRCRELLTDEIEQCSTFKANKLASSGESLTLSISLKKFLSLLPIPYAMEKPFKEEFLRLESLNIIKRVHLSNWSTPIVIVKKPDGKIRLCADYSTRVNRALCDNTYPLPNVDYILTKLSGNKCISVLDLSEAFLQIEVAEDQRDITTITTPKGFFRFRRLPFGIKTAPAIFQQAMNFTPSGLEGVYAYIDDVIVAGFTRQEHDFCLLLTFKRLEEKGWKLRLDKCRFALQEIKYLGLIVNGSGVSADPKATHAIANMPYPTCVSEVQTLLRMINHHDKFIPHLH